MNINDELGDFFSHRIIGSKVVKSEFLVRIKRLGDPIKILLIMVLKELLKEYSIIECLGHNADKISIDDRFMNVSTQNSSLKFSNDNSAHAVILRLASSGTMYYPQFQPFLFKESKINSKVLRRSFSLSNYLIEKNKIKEKKFKYELIGVDEIPISARKVIDETIIREYENRYLKPYVINHLNEIGHTDIKSEYETTAGKIDILSEFESNKFIIELKHVKNKECAIQKLRMAIGQVLTYAHSKEFSNKNTNLWIVMNQYSSVIDNIDLETISELTGIRFFAFKDECLSSLF